MRSLKLEDPKLSIRKAQDLSLSGPALLTLMKAVLAKGASFRFRALGWSMTPFIKNGDVITVTPIKKGKVCAGDIISFIRPGENKLVVHRVIAKYGRILSIQGDSLPDCPADIVPIENIIGQVTRIERSGRSIWLGLGLERYIIAWLSRIRLLVPLRLWIASLKVLLSKGAE